MRRFFVGLFVIYIAILLNPGLGLTQSPNWRPVFENATPSFIQQDKLSLRWSVVTSKDAQSSILVNDHFYREANRLSVQEKGGDKISERNTGKLIHTKSPILRQGRKKNSIILVKGSPPTASFQCRIVEWVCTMLCGPHGSPPIPGYQPPWCKKCLKKVKDCDQLIKEIPIPINTLPEHAPDPSECNSPCCNLTCEDLCEKGFLQYCQIDQDKVAPDPTFIYNLKSSLFSKSPLPACDKNAGLVAMISIPPEGSLVRANVPISGVASGENFQSYRVEYGQGENPSSWNLIEASEIPKHKGVSFDELDDSFNIPIYGNLTTWDTGLRNYVYLPTHPKNHPIDLNGIYTVRLVVTSKDGKTVEDRKTVIVTNVVSNAWGGVIRSSDQKVFLTVQKQSIFKSFKLISIQPKNVETLTIKPDKRKRVFGKIYEVQKPGERFTKEAVLQMAYSPTELGETSEERLGIYGFNVEKNNWENLKSTRRSGELFVFAKVTKLHSHYALMVSELPGEGSYLEIEKKKSADIHHVTFNGSKSSYLVKDLFDGDISEWSNRDGEVGGTVSIDSGSYENGETLKIVNQKYGGNFAVNVRTSPFDAKDYPIVEFDYRIGPDVKTNFLVKVGGRWYDIGFTDDSKVLANKRVNIAHIGDIEGITADDRWHHARFNLYDMLRTKTGNTLVEQMIMADWDVGGFMKLQFGRNRQGATYFIDNFSIHPGNDVGLTSNQEVLLVDHFNKRISVNPVNVFDQPTFLFVDKKGSHIQQRFSSEQSLGGTNYLALDYGFPGPKHYVGYATLLPNLDVRSYQGLTFALKSTESELEVLLGLRDQYGHEEKVAISQFITVPISSDWQEITVPLVAFSHKVDLGKVENLSLTLVSRGGTQGTLSLTSPAFRKNIPSFSVDRFSTDTGTNLLSKKHQPVVSGAAAINGVVTEDGGEGIFRLSYGGNIGELKAYASDVFTYAGWETELGGINCSHCTSLSFRIRGGKGGERPNIYLDDGNFRWSVDIEQYASVTTEWQPVVIPLADFVEYGVDLTHLDALQFIFEWEDMSGTVYLDDIQIHSSLVSEPMIQDEFLETSLAQ